MPRLLLLPLAAVLACSLLASAATPATPRDDVALIKSRLFERYLTAPGPVPHVLGAAANETVEQWVAALQPEGRWPDLVYHDASVPFLRPMPHLYRLVRMAQAYRAPDTSPAVRDAVRPAIHAALRFWLREKPLSANSWFNTIGTPIELAKVLVLMDGELDAAEREGCLEILRRANQQGTLIYSGAPATGQNLLWQAGLQIVAGCFEESDANLARFARRAAEEIVVTTREGIQPDFSFHQHGPQLYSGGYGEGFSVDGAFWASVLHETRFAWPAEAIDVLSAFILDGQQWMSRGRSWDFSAIGRELARSDKDASKLALACDRMAGLATPRREEFLAFAAQLRRSGTPATLAGNRSFWRSDFMSHVRPEAYVSVRMTSRRTFGSESGNGEAIFNYHMGDGAMCLMKTGEEYRNLFPLWNWRRIPGVTCLDSADPLPEQRWGIGSNGGSDFAGGVSDGEFGAAGFELERAGLRGLKSWFFLPEGVVCLGAGLSATSDASPLVTTLNQCWARGPVIVNGQELAGSAPIVQSAPAWVHHDGVAYFIEEGGTLHVTREARAGRWTDINQHHRGSSNEVAGDVFTAWIEHGRTPSRPAQYRTFVVPNLPAAQAATYRQTTAPRVLANTADVQAVISNDGRIVQAVFPRSGHITLPNGWIIGVDRAAALQLRFGVTPPVLTAADPTHSGAALNVRINRRLAGEQCAADAQGTTITFDFPDGAYAGRSIRRQLEVISAAAPVTPVAWAAPLATSATLTRIAFGSCADQKLPQPIWDAILAQKPDVFISAGDNIYADTEDMGVMAAEYARLAAFPGYQRLVSSCPILATWDDHDYGVNDGTARYPKKVESQKLLLDFFHAPADSPRRQRPGLYDAAVYGPPGKRVQIILLDTRYFKSEPAPDARPPEEKARLNLVGWYVPHPDPRTTILGPEQWQWLEAQLRQPAEVRLVVSSIQVIAGEKGMESWGNFPHERRRLYELIARTKAAGVLFLSGDVHFSEISRTNDGPYPFYDFTSSGLTNCRSDWAKATNPHRSSDRFYAKPTFGLVEIAWEGTTPQLKLSARGLDGEVGFEQTIAVPTLGADAK